MSNREVYDKLGDRANNGSTKWKANCYRLIMTKCEGPHIFDTKVCGQMYTLIEQEFYNVK